MKLQVHINDVQVAEKPVSLIQNGIPFWRRVSRNRKTVRKEIKRLRDVYLADIVRGAKVEIYFTAQSKANNLISII